MSKSPKSNFIWKALIVLIIIIFLYLIIAQKSHFDKPYFSLRFDDCFKSFNLAYPLLEESGIKTTLFCNYEFVDSNSAFYLNWSDLASYDKNIVDIQFHGNRHKLIYLNKNLDKTLFEEKGYNISVVAYPYGVLNLINYFYASKHFDTGLIYNSLLENIFPYNVPVMSNYLLNCEETRDSSLLDERLGALLKNNKYYILCFHHVNNPESKYNVNLDEFAKIIDSIKAYQEKGGNILFIKEFKNLKV